MVIIRAKGTHTPEWFFAGDYNRLLEVYVGAPNITVKSGTWFVDADEHTAHVFCDERAAARVFHSRRMAQQIINQLYVNLRRVNQDVTLTVVPV